jgi:hypothetical protein
MRRIAATASSQMPVKGVLWRRRLAGDFSYLQTVRKAAGETRALANQNPACHTDSEWEYHSVKPFSEEAH